MRIPMKTEQRTVQRPMRIAMGWLAALVPDSRILNKKTVWLEAQRPAGSAPGRPPNGTRRGPPRIMILPPHKRTHRLYPAGFGLTQRPKHCQRSSRNPTRHTAWQMSVPLPPPGTHRGTNLSRRSKCESRGGPSTLTVIHCRRTCRQITFNRQLNQCSPVNQSCQAPPACRSLRTRQIGSFTPQSRHSHHLTLHLRRQQELSHWDSRGSYQSLPVIED